MTVRFSGCSQVFWHKFDGRGAWNRRSAGVTDEDVHNKTGPVPHSIVTRRDFHHPGFAGRLAGQLREHSHDGSAPYARISPAPYTQIPSREQQCLCSVLVLALASPSRQFRTLVPLFNISLGPGLAAAA